MSHFIRFFFYLSCYVIYFVRHSRFKGDSYQCINIVYWIYHITKCTQNGHGRSPVQTEPDLT